MKALHLVGLCEEIMENAGSNARLFGGEMIGCVYSQIVGRCCSAEPIWERNPPIGNKSQHSEWDRVCVCKLKAM